MSPSITSWTRLETRTRDAEMQTSISARVFDPLWLLTRQWQMGEFQAQDAGTPAVARVRATSTLLSRCYLGDLQHDTVTQAPAYNPRAIPLEVMVERRRMRPLDVSDIRMLRFAVEGGLRFLRMLELQQLSQDYREAFIARFALEMPAAPQVAEVDQSGLRFAQTMIGRVPDARKLEAAFRAGGAQQVVSDPALNIATPDRPPIQQTALRWLDWYAAVFTEPADATTDAWLPPRLEYSVSVAARISPQPTDERTLTASEFYGGHLDWSSFDLNAEVRMGTDADFTSQPIVQATVPAPVTFRGAPARRFWELEDARIDYGLVPVGPTDLAHMLMAEYASSFGNDWFVVPLTLPVGSLTVVNSLVVVDTFGVAFLLRPIGDRGLPKPYWSMWQLAYTRRPGADAIPTPESNLFFLAPAIGRSMDGAAVEEVLFIRDEIADMAWAIERRVESALEVGLQRQYASAAGQDTSDAAAVSGPGQPPPRYLLSTTVASNWIPLLPVQLSSTAGRPQLRLKRGAVLQPDGSQRVQHAVTQVLNPTAELLLYDEEIPREGVRVTRQRTAARWIDGSTWIWSGYRKQIGRGEGASGLRFDSLVRPSQPAAH